MIDMTELAGLGEQRNAALSEVDALTEQIRVKALEALAGGARKIAVANASGITRPTLDKWLAAAEVN